MEGRSGSTLLAHFCRVFMATFQLEHHPFDVPVILVAAEELQALLRIAPFQDFDRLRTRAPGIHFTLVRHVKIDGVAS